MALTNEDLLAISKLLDTKFEAKLEPIETRLDTIETRLDTIETRLDTIETRLDTIETRLDSMESDVKQIKVTIENEVTTGIQLVAEGHLDLIGSSTKLYTYQAM